MAKFQRVKELDRYYVEDDELDVLNGSIQKLFAKLYSAEVKWHGRAITADLKKLE